MWLRVFLVGLAMFLVSAGISVAYHHSDQFQQFADSTTIAGNYFAIAIIVACDLGALLVAIGVIGGVISWAKRTAAAR